MVTEKENIQELVNDYLVYLVDEGFTITYSQHESAGKVVIHFRKEQEDFTWFEIRDYILPFLEMFKPYALNLIGGYILYIDLHYSQNHGLWQRFDDINRDIEMNHFLITFK